MEKWYRPIAWLLTAGLALAACGWLFPRLFFLPDRWTLSRGEARELALGHLEQLGDAIEDPYVVTQLLNRRLGEMQLREHLPGGDPEGVRGSLLADRLLGWRVTVYEPGALPYRWTHRVELSPAGELTLLRLQVPAEEAAAAVDAGAARARADAFLSELGFDLSRYDEPVLRRTDLESRTDSTLRYRDREALLGDGVPYGLEVSFAGDRLQGFEPWIEDPSQKQLEAKLQANIVLSNFWIMVPYLTFPFAGFFFLRRYHAGEIGVRRALHLFTVAFCAGALSLILSGRGATEGNSFGPVSREIVTWAWTAQMIVFWIAALSMITALCWSVGEARCRERWGQKLAAFDALFQRRWQNATVARSALVGVAAAAILAAMLLCVLLALRPAGAWVGLSMLFGPWWQDAAWPGLALVLFELPMRLFAELFAWLFLLPAAVRRFGTPAGVAVTVALAAILFWPPVATEPVGWYLLIGGVRAAALAFVFLRFDLLATLTAAIGSSVLLAGLPFLHAEDAFLVFQGALPFAVVALPLALSFRYLASGEELVYRYDDVPPHVRRIAERERQRVELETARRIQSSILPELPPQLAGIELAHSYLPATEVGGDFYDVMALEDGRLAVAVGDVAGHGVSSGLIMSMAKSTLALQVTVNPDVETVLHTLNRTVYQSARLRLLTTLCYAVVDRERRELLYGSAGHIAPYRIDAAGRVEALASASYPLGVRDRVNVEVRNARIEAGDQLFLFSDGVVEARREGSDELFGFERLEESLSRHAGKSPEALRDGVLGDLERFTGGAPREDDQTILVLRVP